MTATMQALVYDGPHRVSVRALPRPVAIAGQVRLRPLACGICGTDIGIHAGTHPRAQAPLVLGHEFVAEVLDAPPGSGFSARDRVVPYPLRACGNCHPCRTGNPHVCDRLRLVGIDFDGGLAEEIWLDPGLLFPVPPEMNDSIAAMIEPLAVVLHGLKRAGMRSGDRCLVTGAGPIGLLTALVLKASGAADVIVSDLVPSRLALAASFGCIGIDVSRQDLISEVQRVTDGDGADVVFECSGAPAVAVDLSRLARARGTICLLSLAKGVVPVDLLGLSFREQALVGSRVYTREDFGRAVEMAGTLAVSLQRLVTHVVPLSASATVFDLLADPRENAVKVVVDCTA